ncbi:MAG TPA: hypothetical protein VMC02_09680 [Steroidobacteraceae bacterium]|nr:hypothetical protein [Steroidobacteraceae bacterium]
MNTAVGGRLTYVVLWFRIFYGMHLTYSAGRHYLGYAPKAFLQAVHYTWSPHLTHPVAGPFIDAITAAGIYPLVKAIELVVGLALLMNRFVPLMLVVEMPISVVIFILNFFVVGTDRQLFSGPQEIVLNLLLIGFYAGYYRPLLRPRASPWPWWTEGPCT